MTFSVTWTYTAAHIDHHDGTLVTRPRAGLEQRTWDGACGRLTGALHGRVESCKAHRVVAQVGEEVGSGGVVRERVVGLVRVLVAELSEVGG